MKVRVSARKLADVLSSACNDKFKQECTLEALQDKLVIRVSDGVSYSEISMQATVEETGTINVFVPMLARLLKTIGSDKVTLFPHKEMARLVVQLDNGAQYLLPLGFNRNGADDNDAFSAQVTELMAQATPFISFNNAGVWTECGNAVKPYRGEWDFNYIWIIPLRKQPEWAMSEVVAAVAATDQTIFAASLLTSQQAEVLTDEDAVLLIPPAMTAFEVRSFAYASKDDDRQYVYAILDEGYVCAPTVKHPSEHYHRVAHNLLFAPASVQLQIPRPIWQHLKKAIQAYAERRVKYSRTGNARWDICPDGTHRIWSAVENDVLFTSEKITIEGTLPQTFTFWVSLLEKAVKFIPAPSIIELIPQQNTCMMRLHDQFNYRICVLMSMVADSDYDSFRESQREMRSNAVTTDASEEDETEVSEYAEI